MISNTDVKAILCLAHNVAKVSLQKSCFGKVFANKPSLHTGGVSRAEARASMAAAVGFSDRLQVTCDRRHVKCVM